MSRSFNGSSDLLSYAGAVVSGLPLTLDCWFLADTTGAIKYLVSVLDSASASLRNQWSLETNTGNTVVALTGSATGQSNSSSAGWSTGVWNHAAAVFASDTSRIAYLNGTAGVENTISRIPAGVDRTCIGKQDNAGNNFWMDGLIAFATIRNVALNAREVAALAAGVHPLNIRPDSIAAFWPLDGDDSPEPDRSPAIVTATRYNLTLTGTTKGASGPPVKPYSARKQRATWFVPAGGTTVNLSPVTMAAAVAAPARLLALGQTPVAVVGGVVAPARALALAAAPVSAAASVPDTDEVLTPTTGQGTAAGTAVTPTLALSAAQTPATAALSVPASVAGLAPSVGQGQAVGAVAAPTLTLAAAVGSVVITGAVVTPSTDGSTTVLPAAITVAAAVAAPALSLGLVQAPVTVALTVVAPTAALSSVPAAVTVAAGVAAPTLALSSPQGTVGAAGSVVAPTLALGLGVVPASATGGVVAPAVQAGNVQSPGTVTVTAAVAAPALALTQSVAALTALFTIPAVDIQGLTVHDLLLGTAEVLPGLGGTLRALPQLNGVAELLPNLGGRVVLNPLV